MKFIMTRRNRRSDKTSSPLLLKIQYHTSACHEVTAELNQTEWKYNLIKKKEFHDSLFEHFILLGVVIGGLMYTQKLSRLGYRSLGPIRKSRVCQVLFKDNDYRVATYETNMSLNHMILGDTFLDGVYNQCNKYRIVPWLHGSG